MAKGGSSGPASGNLMSQLQVQPGPWASTGAPSPSMAANPVSATNPVVLNNPVAGSPALSQKLPQASYDNSPNGASALMNQLRLSATGQGMPGAPAGGGASAPMAAGQDAAAAMMAAQQGSPYAPTGGAAAAASAQAKIAELLKALA